MVKRQTFLIKYIVLLKKTLTSLLTYIVTYIIILKIMLIL
jgi:hypothetical protein